MDLISFYGVFSLFIFLLFTLQLKKVFKSIINPFLLFLVTFSISFTTALYLFNVGYIEKIEFYIIFMFFFLFGAAFFSLVFIVNDDDKLSKFNSIAKPIDYQVLYIIFFLSAVISIFYIFKLWSQYGSGDERLLLNRELRVLSLLNMLFSFWVVVLSGIIYSKDRDVKVFFILSSTILLAFFSGSKGAAIGLLIWAIYFYSVFNKLSFSRVFIVIMLVLAVLIIPTWWMYGSDFINIILYRVSMSGDVYLLSFVAGDYRELIGLFDPLSYIMHPFTSLVGVRGYEFPFGAELIGTAGNVVTGTGPNPHLPMLAITFWPNCLMCSFLFAMLFVTIFLVTVVVAFKVYNNLIFPLYFRIYIFSSLLLGAFNILIDIGMFQFHIVLSVFSFFIYLFFLFLKQMSRPFKLG